MSMEQNTAVANRGPGLFAGGMPTQRALQEMRLRLLDLTSRNRLINFKPSPGKSLQLVHSTNEGAFDRLVVDTARLRIQAIPEPKRNEWVERAGRMTRPEPREYAARAGIDVSYELGTPRKSADRAPAVSGSEAFALLYGEDLGKHCRKLEREAKLAIEETGANMFFLVLGQLEYPEDPLSDKLLRAPLICVPVNLIRTDEGQYGSFYLSYNGDDLEENLSLREKLRRDFGLSLPTFDSESGAVGPYLCQVDKVVSEQPNWRIHRTMTLALLSFTNMLLVKDLDPENWAGDENGVSRLLIHPLIKQVFEGRPEASGGTGTDDEVRIDEHPRHDLPVIYDVDSSQHRALIDVLDGNNRVIEGPPGTGKSQTITNLIAAALHDGKKVLFVAEKLAALQVVQERLARAGLDPFVLELHSNKTTKKQLVEAVERRLKLRLPVSDALFTLLQSHEEKRQALKAYADLVNSVVCNGMHLTLHKVLWKAERNRIALGEAASALRTIRVPGSTEATELQFRSLCDLMRQLGEQYERINGYNAAHPLWGLFPREYRPQDDVNLASLLRTWAPRLTGMSMALNDMATLMACEYVNLSAPSADALAAALTKLAPSHPIADELLPAMFSVTDPHGQTAATAFAELEQLVARIQEAETRVRVCLTSTDHDEARATIAEKLAPALQLCGWSELDAAGLAQAREAIQGAAQGLELALGHMREFTTVLGMTFNSTRAALTEYETAAAALAKAPMAHLHLRHQTLREPAALARLLAAQAKAHKLNELQRELDGSLYLDSVPGDAELTAAISTLREGAKWYRIFQAPWRSAIALHRRLERNKSKISADKRLGELETLRDYERSSAAFENDRDVAVLAGDSFRGRATPFIDLTSVASWVSSVDDVRLSAKALAGSTFDPMTADRARVLRAVEAAKTVPTAAAALMEFDSTVTRLLSGAVENILGPLRAEDLSARVAAAKKVVEGVRGAMEQPTDLSHGPLPRAIGALHARIAL
jgi:hypothetical protein